MTNVIRRAIGRRYFVLRDHMELSREGRQPCRTETLGVMSQRDLTEIFNRDATREQWLRAEAVLKQVFPVEDLTTWGVNPGDRRALWYLINALKPASVLEVGTHVGASTLHIASALQSLSNGQPVSGRRMVTVDIEDVNAPNGAWNRFGVAMPPRETIRSIGCDGLVQFVTSPSVPFLERCSEKFDFIFLDGDHAAATVYNELPRSLRLLNPGGVVLLHDYFPGNRQLWRGGRVIPGPYVAVQRLRKEGAALDVLPLGSLPWATKLGSNTTSLALVVRAR